MEFVSSVNLVNVPCYYLNFKSQYIILFVLGLLKIGGSMLNYFMILFTGVEKHYREFVPPGRYNFR